jgi:PAS domain-containing protein
MCGETMAKIAFIASDKNLYTQGKISIQELGLQNKVVIYFARLQRAARLAKVLQNEDISVIIARGGTAKLINESNINIPIVEIIVTGQDLAAMFQESQHATGIQNPKVAFIAFENIAPDMEALSHVLGIDLTVHRIKEPADIPLMIQTVAQAPYDVLVGGIKTVVMAQKLGLKTILIHSGSYSIKAALLEAQKIALGRKIEKENAGKFKALIDYSIEGIISVDHEERVQVFNPAAEQLLRISSKDILGRKINILTGSMHHKGATNHWPSITMGYNLAHD